MTEEKKEALAAIEARKGLVCDVADHIWEYAELSLQEFKSAALYCEVLEKEGFRVKKGISGIETAFSASYGSGRPVIGLLAEYDALSGLSQTAGCIEEKPLKEGGSGHGCGHNILGAGAMAAALGVKAYLEQNQTAGTVILYGCPGEEGGAAKAFMARDGVWKNLDAALTWHPDDVNEVATGSSNACIQTQYKFHGIASHAAGAPEMGRSALDAVELMNTGVQYLREHMSDKARIHYAITDAGGCSPNVVQAKASVLYMVRSNHVAEAVELQKRVDKIAQGAALMDELMQGVLSVVAHWLGPDTAIQMAASYAGTPAGVTDGSAAIAVIGGADGPTAIFVTSRYNAQALWGLAVKVFSNVLVIVLNYVFSKLIIFKKK